MIVQIYDIYDTSQLDKLLAAGVDHFGMPVISSKDFVGTTVEDAKKITSYLRGKAKSVLLTLSSDVNEIVSLANQINPDFIQLQVPIEQLSLEMVKNIKSKLLNINTMVAIPITDDNSINLAKKYSEVADYLLLDSVSGNQYGVTGKTHNWDISKNIVQEVGIPVILAGGLGPENVSEAIEKVKPWGVDSKTKTDTEDKKYKDIEKVKEFVSRAKGR